MNQREKDLLNQFSVWSSTKSNVVTADEARAQGELHSGQARTVLPAGVVDETRHSAMQPHGACRHFRYQEGQAQIREEQLFKRLIHDERYDANWFMAHEKTYGVCDIFEGFACSAMSPGKIPIRFTDPQAPFHVRDKSVTCPFWEDRRKRGEKMLAGRYTKRSEVY